MSVTAAAPTLGRPPRMSFRNILNSEWAKILTVRSTFYTLLVGFVATVGISALLAWANVFSWDDLDAKDKATFNPMDSMAVGVNLGMVAFGVLGVMVITSEYATGMIRTSITAVPRRTKLLAAKVLVLGIVVLTAAEVVSFASFFVSQLILDTKDIGTTIETKHVFRAVVGGGLYLTAIALLGIGLGTILRHTAGAVTLVLGLLFVLPIIGALLPGDWGDTVAEYLPSNAGNAVMNILPTDNSLEPWTGFGVFCAYVVVALVAAFYLFRRRDA